MSKKKVLIIGAGPAGLTAALELVRAGIQPIVIEADTQVGGISKTINFEGNRMDLGGHRFFSKSDWVMNWWQEILPVEMDSSTQSQLALSYQNQSQLFTPTKIATAKDGDRVMLIRPRLSRIYYLRKFFDYPVKLNLNTIGNLGLLRMGKIGVSYGLAMVMPIKNERTLEDFLINRFGRELYRTFFKDYTEKVWGVPCAQISAEWGAQRIKGLSITKALLHAAKQVFGGAGAKSKNIETSLIEQFMYPKLGPGQLWEVVAEKVIEGGGQIFLNQRAIKIHREGFNIVGADILDTATGNCRRVECTEFISTIPVKELIENLHPSIDGPPLEIASALPYRDFITVGLLVPRMVPRMVQATATQGTSSSGMPADNWIYIQEPDVKLGRLQIFNNWSPAMVKDPATIFLGLEYFCTQGDALWNMSKDQLLTFAANELEKIGLIKAHEVISGTVVKVPKAYPAYFGTYTRMPELRTFFAQFPNLYLVGRNGMHRYNNQDHSMVSAKVAVDCILNPTLNRDSIWDINVEQEYHEEK